MGQLGNGADGRLRDGVQTKSCKVRRKRKKSKNRFDWFSFSEVKYYIEKWKYKTNDFAGPILILGFGNKLFAGAMQDEHRFIRMTFTKVNGVVKRRGTVATMA